MKESTVTIGKFTITTQIIDGTRLTIVTVDDGRGGRRPAVNNLDFTDLAAAAVDILKGKS